MQLMIITTDDGSAGMPVSDRSVRDSATPEVQIALPVSDRSVRDSATPEVQIAPSSSQELPSQPPTQCSPSNGAVAQGAGAEHKAADQDSGTVSQVVQTNDITDGPVVPSQSPKKYVIMLKSRMHTNYYNSKDGSMYFHLCFNSA